MRPLLFIFFLVLSHLTLGSTLEGTVYDQLGKPLQGVSVSVLHSNDGTSTNSSGGFRLDLDNGNYTIQFSYLGYETKSEKIQLTTAGKVLEIYLKESDFQLAEAEVIADSRDKAREIMKEVRNARTAHLKAVVDFKVNVYQQVRLENKLVRPSKQDSINYLLKKEKDPKTPNPFEVNISEIHEFKSEMLFKSPGKTKEKILGINSYTGGEISEDVGRSMSAGSGLEFGENIITPEFSEEASPWILFEGAQVLDINIYKTLLDLKSISDKPILSPLAAASAVSYRFDYVGTVFRDGQLVYHLSVVPLNSLENLFQGDLLIRANDYSVFSYDLRMEGGNLLFCNAISFKSNYSEKSKGVYVADKMDIEYTIKDGKRDVTGSVTTDFSDYDVNTGLINSDFGREIKTIEPTAYDQDEEFWNVSRKSIVDSISRKFMTKSDSVANYYESPTYLAKLDSAFNKVDIWTPIIGYGRRNRVKGHEFYIEGALAQIVPLGIGGYRHRLPGYFQKDFKNDFRLRVEGHADYGFRNKDFKGKAIVGFTYFPQKFVRTRLKFGDYYDMINDYASLEQTFSGSNFVRTKMLGIAQRMEIFNGFYAEASFEYADQIPLRNIEFSDWRNDAFGELNEPSDFERYKKTEFRFQVEYRFRQEYYFKKKRKILTPSKFPTLTFLYRKGIKNLFNSEVDFDYLEIGARQEIEVGRFGSTRWEANLASFVNKKSLRKLEYKYFRGSDQLLFSDPLRSFQLLGFTLNTPNSYLRINAIHHFEGTILNKIPLVRRLKMGLAVGGGLLSIPKENLHHVEYFAGVEKSFKLFKQLLRGGFYAVSAENNFDSTNLTYKVGLTFYEPFTRKWGY